MPGFPASLVGLDTAGGGVILGGGQVHVRVNGLPIGVQGDRVATHGSGPHGHAVIVGGVQGVRLNGLPVCVAGTLASCGHAATGSARVRLTP